MNNRQRYKIDADELDCLTRKYMPSFITSTDVGSITMGWNGLFCFQQGLPWIF